MIFVLKTYLHFHIPLFHS